MTNQEIRRVMSRGSFTELLDFFATTNEPPYGTLRVAFEEAKTRIDPDEMQELYLRFFTLQTVSICRFGVPSLQQQSLEVMKMLNNWDVKAVEKIRRLLKDTLSTLLQVFTDVSELFRRALPLSDGVDTRVWSSSNRMNKYVWDSFMGAIARIDDRLAIVQNGAEVRDALVHAMQTRASFRTLTKQTTQERIDDSIQAIKSVITPIVRDRRLTTRERTEAVQAARKNSIPCNLCKQPLPKFNDLCMVDHTMTVCRGGKSTEMNTQVTHKVCNLSKGGGGL
jgi:hypothetical protein